MIRAGDDRRIVGVRVKGVSKLPAHTHGIVEIVSMMADKKRFEVITLILATLATQKKPERLQEYFEAIETLGKRIPSEDLVGT